MAECSHDIESDICSRKNVIEAMRQFYKMRTGKTLSGDPKKVISIVANLLGVKDELDILTAPEFKQFAGRLTEIEKNERFLPKGPKNTTALLDNFNIDDTLRQLARRNHPKSTHRYRFYHIPFQMIDFEKYNTELANLSVKSLVEEGYNSFGCVLNTDVSTGPGKHWFCISWDGTGAGTDDDPWVFEYFNSSGNYPRAEVHDWMRAQIAKTARDLNKKTIIHIVATYQLQNDNHSCGVYCLAYIYHRLHDKPRGWFIRKGLSDRDMLEFRKKLFRDK